MTDVDKDARDKLIERLAAENAAMAEDMAERKALRELRGEYFDDLPVAQRELPATIYKTNDSALTQSHPAVLDETLKRAVAQFVVEYTSEKLESVADLIGTETGAMERRLHDQINALRIEIDILRAAVRSGNLQLIGGRDEA